MKKQKCYSCGEIIKEDEGIYTTVGGKLACEGCYEASTEYASTLFRFNDGKIDEIKFNEDFGVLNSQNEVDYPLDVMPHPVKKQKWVSSGGWRGYTDWVLVKDYIKITDGWITGYPDENTQSKAELGDYFEDLQQGKIKPPVPIYWIFGMTSNVFSQTSCIVIHKSHKKAIEQWLLEINGGLKEFAEKFN